LNLWQGNDSDQIRTLSDSGSLFGKIILIIIKPIWVDFLQSVKDGYLTNQHP